MNKHPPPAPPPINVLATAPGFSGVDRLYEDVIKEEKFNISRRKIKEWLMKQDAYTLHKPISRHLERNCVIVGRIDQ